jgi:pimeloyl-ACP methyl ester carboxylesterase
MPETPLGTVPGSHKYVDVDGIRAHYVVAGDGSPVVLLHGLGASVVAWRDNIAPLAGRFTVYAVDIPGHGDSAKPRMAYTLDQGVDFLTSFLDAVGVPAAAFVGNSMGGLIALRTAMERPERASHLVLVDSAGLGREVSPFLRLMSAPLLGEVLERSSAKGTEAMLRVVFSQRDFITPELVDELTRTRASPGAKRAVLRMLRHGVGFRGVRPTVRFEDQLPGLSVPVLVVWGEKDRVFPVAQAIGAARASPSVRLAVFPGCGHWPQMERAAEFNDLLLDFLGGES